MKKHKFLYSSLVLGSTLFVLFLVYFAHPPVDYKAVTVNDIDNVVIAKPRWDVRANALVFSNNQHYPAEKLAKQLTSNGVATAIVDSTSVFRLFNASAKRCLDVKQINELINKVSQQLAEIDDKPLLITGIGDGALIPFINAQSVTEDKTTNVSVGFSVNMPADLALCPPYNTEIQAQKRYLTDVPVMKGRWRSIWNEKPVKETAIFIKEKVSHADTDIAAYNTPLDTLLMNEVLAIIGQGSDTPPMPVVEIPGKKIGDTVTLFYSGDGGWRDLDRSVAQEMAKLNYSVLGVDVLRYFWERKAPAQVASDLIATMRFYRSKWGVKSFVLAGFSFGADILPVIYNQLPETEKDNVPLLVFLALGNHADFEVHVAGWLGQSTHEIPLIPELEKIPKNKVLCIYGKEEKAKTGTACTHMENSAARIVELPGGHHFDEDYPKLARLILDNYHQHGID